MIQISIDRPAKVSSLQNETLEVVGWAYSKEGIADCRVALDGASERAMYGLPRPDVGLAIAGAEYSGFYASIPFNRPSGLIGIVVTCESASGELSELRKTVELTVGDLFAPGLVPASCPICGGQKYRVRTKARVGYSGMQCDDCTGIFLSPIPAGDFLQRYYNENYWESATARIKAAREHYDSPFLARLIRETNPSIKNVCEIGCGPGTILNGLRSAGFDVRGIELSSSAADAGQKLLGLEISVGGLDSLHEEEECILLRHMIEHSPDPASNLRHLRKYMPVGGVLVIVTPNSSSLVYKILNDMWEWYIPPVHICLFNIESLGAAAKAAGFHLLKWSTRRGDGRPTLPVLKALSSYKGIRDDPVRSQLMDGTIKAMEDFSGPAWEQVVAAAGQGNELVAVFEAV